MGGGIRRASGAVTGNLQITDAVAAKIDNYAFAFAKLALIQRLQRTERLGAPAEQRLRIGNGVDDGKRRSRLTMQLGDERVRFVQELRLANHGNLGIKLNGL